MTGVSKKRVLVVDDDRALLGRVRAHLERQGHEVATAESGAAGLKLAESAAPHLVVLDISFPDSKTSGRATIDGVEVLRRLREAGNVPVLMLSSTNSASVKVMALSIGADDYLSKPFELQELSGRIEAILRRTDRERPRDRVLSFGRLRLDPGERRLWKDGNPVELTGIEFDILHTMARRPRHVFTRDKLIENAWAHDSSCVPKVVDVHVGHIRRKIEDDPAQPVFLVTVRGTGYRFDDPGESADASD